MRLITITFLSALTLFTLSPTIAHADCANPNGIAGDQIYNSTHKTMQFCDGTNWYSMKGGASSTPPSSQYTKEFSGKISGSGNWPTCTDPAKIITIGTVQDTVFPWSFVEVTVYGNHRGYTNTGYFEYKQWVIMVGDKVSSNLIKSSGTANTLNMYNGSTTGNYDNIEIGTGFDIRLHVAPNCGSNIGYTYVVQYGSDANFTPHTTRNW